MVFVRAIDEIESPQMSRRLDWADVVKTVGRVFGGVLSMAWIATSSFCVGTVKHYQGNWQHRTTSRFYGVFRICNSHVMYPWVSSAGFQTVPVFCGRRDPECAKIGRIN